MCGHEFCLQSSWNASKLSQACKSGMHDSRTPIHCLFLFCSDAGRLYRVKGQPVNNCMNEKDYVQEIAAANTSLGSKQGFSWSFACGALSE